MAERRILIRYEPGTSTTDRVEARDAVDAEYVRSFSLVPRLQLLELPESTDRDEAIEALEEDPSVTYAEPDLIRQLQATNPNDTFYKSPYFYLWGLNNTGQTFTVNSISYTGTPDADIDAPEAWDLSRGSPNVTVAVIDSGMQLNHPDLAANLWTNSNEVPGNSIDDDGNGRIDDVNGWDFVNNDNNPSDDDGHGTHVAGTIGAVGNNNTGVTGVAWNVKLMPLKACDATGSCALSATIAALNYAVAQGVKISNNSYGGIGSQSTSERNAIIAARDAGHLFVAAAGNDGVDTDLAGNSNYPSNYTMDNIVSVASTTLNDGLSSFSNWGSTSVDLGAPGSQIASTYPTNQYVWLGGTSMASPHVAGVAALIKARKPTWSYSQIRSRLLGNTRPLSALSGKSVTGGMLNAYDALLFAPDPPIIGSGPSAFVSSSSAEFTFSGETVGAGVTFQCRIDSGSWSSCSSPKDYTSLSQGSHTFEVRQTDQAGNTSDPTSRTWTVDTVAPAAPAITTGPNGFVSSTAASFSFTGEASATFECRLDSGTWEACSSPKSYTSLSQGSHTFEVRQTDQAGNVSTVASRNWTVDTVAPAAPSITTGPNGFVSSTSATFAFTGEASAAFECRIDSGSWSSCSSPKDYTSLSQGSHTFEVRQTDQASNTSDPASRTWTVDTVAPAAPSVTTGPNGFVSSTSATLSFTGEASATFECRIDSGGWEACSSPKSYTSLSQGSHTFEVRQTDQASNTSDPASRTWTVDTVAPDAPGVTSGPSGTIGVEGAIFEFTGEASAAFECRIDSGSWEACSSPKEYTGLSQGSHTFEVRQVDQAGNVSAAATRTWVVDLVSPPPSITSAPSGFVNSTSATFAFTGEASATFECRLDGGSWEACTSPSNYTGLSQGSHTFEVRQTDQASNTSDPASRNWTVDTVAPAAPAITTGPNGFVSSTAASFSFTGEASATFECRLDSGTWEACSSPKSYTSLSQGSHTFEVRQVDQAGNTSDPTSRTWTVDTIAPAAPSVISAPSGFVSSTSASFSFSGEPSAIFECRIDSGSWSSCSSPKDYTSLSQGSHTFEVRQTDQASNASDPASRTWTVDTVAPAAPSVTSAPSGFVSSTSATFAFTGEASAAFECRLDSGDWSSCSSPRDYLGLSQGSHTFDVRQTDQAGNVSTAATRNWTVDTVAPTAPSITTGPNGFVSSTAASFSFTGEPSAAIECRIDSGSWEACISPKDYAGLSQGSHTFDVRQTDQAGNVSTAATRNWTVDTITPAAPSITTGPNGFVSSTSATFAFTGEASATFECRIDSGSWEACSSPKNYTSLSQGSHTFDVRQTDRAGNVSTAASRTWTVDTVVPAAPSVTSAPSAFVSSTAASFSFTGEASAAFECRIDSGSWSSCSSPKEYAGLSQGSHTFEVRQTDQAGNVSAAATRNWTVDTVAPAAPSITAGPNGFVSSTAASFSFTGEASAAFECRLDSGSWEACTSPKSYTGLSQGSHTFEVRQTDQAGNTSDPTSRTWTVDTITPAAPSITAGPNGFVSSTSATLSFTGEASATFECRLDGGSWEACTSPRNYTSLSQGSHTFEVRQTDQAGNVSAAATRNWTVDTVAPAAPSITAGPNGFVSSTAASFSFTGEASAAIECRIDSGGWSSCSSPKDYTSLSQGSHTFDVRQTDQAGNVSTAASRSWTVDTVAPDAPEITSGPDSLSGSAESTFAFTGEPFATFECSRDGSTWIACTSPRTLSSLAEGPHTFELRQTDRAGNTSAPARFEWDVVLTVEPPEITTGPEGDVNSTSAVFEFSWQEGATLSCRVDEGPLSPCSSPFEVSGLSAGPHELRVEQTDALGNTSLETSRSWVVLEVATVQPAVAGTDETGAIIFEGAPEGFTYLCAVGSEELHPCESPYAPAGLTDGTYPVRLVIQDPEGNLSAPLATDFVVEGAPAPPSGTPSVVLNGDATYTRSGKVELGVVWPAGARSIVISNTTDFSGPSGSVTSTLTWTLTSGQGKRKVSVRFLGAGNVPIGTASDTIFLDPKKPNLNSAKIRKRRGKVWWTTVYANDSGSGLAKLAFATRKTKPGINAKPKKVVRFVKASTVKIKLSPQPRWVKVRDKAGNWSGWRYVKPR